ncbi:MAG: fumarylacetoacetate hydrolase family protein [Xanthobacteraceae bacterium]|nr:fumarylacetoacetate hydrolase family protein [Xanthobacteraceae bacterium]
MRLVTFNQVDRGARVGALVDGDRSIVDLQLAAERSERPAQNFRTMLTLIDGGERALDDARALLDRVTRDGIEDAVVPREEAALLAPVPVPRQMRDFLTFEQHLRNARAMRFRKMAARESDPEAAFADYVRSGVVLPPDVWYAQPIYYKCNRFGVIGTDTDIRWPSYANVLDYELEFGVFLGKGGVNIPAAKARDCIFGYTIFNDVSARDAQSREMEGQLGPAKGKDFDTGNVMGPCLVTADEVPDAYALTMTARINGEEWTRGSSATMHWTFEQIIEFVSRDETLYPGEFLGSGTVGGGCGLELDRFLAPGDLIELEVERIGTLRNRIVKSPAPAQPKLDALLADSD